MEAVWYLVTQLVQNTDHATRRGGIFLNNAKTHLQFEGGKSWEDEPGGENSTIQNKWIVNYVMRNIRPRRKRRSVEWR